MKLMEMCGREEILLERETASPIIPKIPHERIDTSFINPSLKWDSMYRQRLVFIFTYNISTPKMLRGDERCLTISERRGNEVRDDLRSRKKLFSFT